MYDDYIDSLLDKYARQYSLPIELVRSVAAQESGSQGQSAVSPKGAIGVMQLMPDTAKELGVDPYDTEQNIEGGARYLRNLYKKYEGNLNNVLGGYNAGPGAVDAWGGIPPYKQTQDYVAGVQAKMNQRQSNAKIVASEPMEEEQQAPKDNSNAKIVASEPMEEAEEQQPAATPVATVASPVATAAAPQDQPVNFFSLPIAPGTRTSQVAAVQPQPQPQQQAQPQAPQAAPRPQAATPPQLMRVPQGKPQPQIELPNEENQRPVGEFRKVDGKLVPIISTETRQLPKQQEQTDWQRIQEFLLSPPEVVTDAVKELNDIMVGPMQLIQKGIVEPVAGMTSPFNIATMGALGGVGAVASQAESAAVRAAAKATLTTASVLFAGESAKQIYREAPLAWKAYQEGNYTEAMAQLGNMGSSAVMGTLAAMHAHGELSDIEAIAAAKRVLQERANAQERWRQRGAKPAGPPQPAGPKRIGQEIDAGFGEPGTAPPKPPADSPFADIVGKEPLEDEYRPTDEDIDKEMGIERQPQPQQPEQRGEGPLFEQPQPKVEDNSKAKIVASEPLEEEPQQAELDASDPIQWIRGRMDAGQDVSIGQVQRQFKMGYGKARDVLREAMTGPGTIEQQPHEQPAGQEPSEQPGESPGRGVSDVGGGAPPEGAALPPAVSPVPGDVPPGGYRGTPETVIHVPHTDVTFPAQYKVVEASALTPSHDPVNFQPKPEYRYKNERDYTKQENQFRILEQVRRFAAQFLVTNNPDAVNGPPMVDHHGNAFGGNSRLMTIQRIYQMHPEKAAAYRDYLAREAPIYGVNPAQIAQMKEPVLVRELNNPGDAQKIISEMNKTGTAAMSPGEQALSDSKRVSTTTLDYIHHILEKMGDNATLHKAVSGPEGAELVQMLVNDGIITLAERPEYLTPENVITPEGKTKLSRLMVGRFFQNVPQYEHTPPSLRVKLERVAASLARLEGRPDWDVLNAPIREGLEILHDAQQQQRSKNLEDVNAQEGLYRPRYSPEGMAWAHAIQKNSGKTLGAAINRYLELEKPSRPGEVQDMFAPPPVSQAEAFQTAFKGLQAGDRGTIFKAYTEPYVPKPVKGGKKGRKTVVPPPAEPLAARRRNIDQGSMFGQQGMDLEAPREPEQPPAKKTHKLAGAEQESIFAPEENEAQKAAEKTAQAKLLGEQLTEQMRSGQAMRPANLKPAETRNMFDEEPEQEGLFSRKPPAGQGSLFGEPEHFAGPPPKPLAPGKQRSLFDEVPDEAPPPPRLLTPEVIRRIPEDPSLFDHLPGSDYQRGQLQSDTLIKARFIPVELAGIPSLKMNGHGMQLMAWADNPKTVKPSFAMQNVGILWPEKHLRSVIQGLEHIAWTYRASPEILDPLHKLRDYIDNILASPDPSLRRLPTYQAGSNVPKKIMREAAYEEADHFLQTKITGNDYADHVNHVRFLGSPAGRIAAETLHVASKGAYDNRSKDPFKRGKMALEVGVRLMRPDRWKELGLTPTQAVDLAESYIDLLFESHGAKALPIIEHVYNAFEEQLKPNARIEAAQTRGRSSGQAESSLPARGPPEGRLESRRLEGDARPEDGDLERRVGRLRPETPARTAEPLASHNPDEFIEKPPASGSEIEEIAKGNPKGGPDDGPLLGAGLGSLHPYVMKGIKAGSKYFSKSLADKLEKEQKRKENKPRYEAGKITPQEIYKGLDVQRGYTSERDLWHTAAIQQAEEARRYLGKDGADKKLESEALTIYRDFKSRPGQLAKWINGTHPNMPGNSGWPHDPVQRAEMQKNRDHVEKWIKGHKALLDQAQNPTPGMLKADAALTHLAEMTLQEGQVQKMLSSTIKPENYAPHNYEKDDPTRPLFDDAPSQKGNIKQHFEYGEERQHPTILDGIAHGLLPRNLNAIDNFIVHGDKFATARATRMFVRSLVRQSKLGVWAMGPKGAPQDWVAMGPNTSVFRYITPTGRTVRLYVPRWVDHAMQPVYKPNALRDVPGIGGLRQWQARNKEMALSLSMFHFYAMQLEAINSMPNLAKPLTYGDALKQMAKGTFSSGWKNEAQFQEAERDLVKHGGTTSIQGHMIDAYKALSPHELPGLWDTKFWSQPVLNLLPKTAKKLTEYTFGQVQRYYKVSDYERKVQGWIADHPNHTQAELKEAKQSYATYVNNVYGGLHWENLKVSKTAKEIMSAVQLAPDWTAANAGQLLQMLQQSGKNWREGKPGSGTAGAYWKGQFTGGTSPGGQAMRAYWLKVGLFAFATGQAASIMATGKPNPDPLHHPFDVYLGKEANGTDKWATMTLRGAGYDIYRLIRAMIEKDAITAGGEFLRAKSAPGVRELVTIMSRRDPLGQPLTNPKLSYLGRSLQAVSKVAPGFAGIPFNIANLYSMALNNSDPERKRHYTAGEIMLNIIGLSPPYRRTPPHGMRLNRQGEMEEIPEEASHGKLWDQVKEGISGKRYKEE